jgi:hypothetical protein
LAIHSHSAPIFRLRCISNARKNLTFTWRTYLYLSLKYISYFHNILWFL